MPATVEICESNENPVGGGELVTHNIANTNMGDADEADLDPLEYPISPGENSYEKYQRFHLTALNGSSRIDQLKIWRAGALGGSAAHKTNAREAGYVQKNYAAPVKTTSTQATQAMPTSEPAGPDLGIGGDLDGYLEGVGYSDYLVHQLQTDAGDTEGSTSTMNYQYREIA